MENSFLTRLKNGWNVFMDREDRRYIPVGNAYSYRPDRVRMTRGNERSIITSVFNRIALDCSSVGIQHVRLDNNDRYLSPMDTPLNSCLTLETNLDQTPRAFIQDVVMSLFDEGRDRKSVV